MDGLDNQLAQLEKAQLVRRLVEGEPAYLFKHALTQDSAYESMLVKKRHEIHRHVAKAYEELYPQALDEYAGMLVYHYAQAGDKAKTFEYALRAGDVAKRLSAYTEARSYYDTALSALAQLPDTDEHRRARVETTIKQVTVAWGIDTFDQNLARLFEAEALAQALPDIADRLSLAQVRYWIGRIYSYGNQHLKALEYYEQVLATAHETKDEKLLGLALALGARTYHVQGDFGKGVPLFEQALPYLEKLGDWNEWILAQVSLAISLAAQGHYEQARTHGEEAIQRALVLNDRGSVAIAYLMSARVEFMVGNVQKMLDVVWVWAKEAAATYPLVHYMALGFQGWAESRLGMHERARASMAAADAVAAKLGPRLIFADWFAAGRAEIELSAGNALQALRLAQIAIAEAQAAGGVYSEGIAERIWGQALLAIDPSNYHDAETHLQKSLTLLEKGKAMIEAARTHVVWGKILQAQGDFNSAREHFDQAARLVPELEETRGELRVAG